MEFRKDINGLRAIAVIAIVLFHFVPSSLPGGFAGVDVFFVISGFLMTGIIFKGLEEGNFSLVKFYIARANRIIPTLIVFCSALLVLGWFLTIPIDYKAMGKHVASSLSFLSNFIYWKESGYFDTASHEKWLLHTWSLSVEWQFYIIYPLLLIFLQKIISIKRLKQFVCLITLIGFIFCVFATSRWPNSSFYLLPARLWEMTIGGVAYLYPLRMSDNRKKFFEWFGLILIITSYLFVSKESPWPGYLAIFPVVGIYIVLQAQRNDSFLTGNPVFQLIGKWSYSIYLWHWPLVVAIYYYSLSSIYIYIGIILSVLLGFLSNKYIEKIKFKNDSFNGQNLLKSKTTYMVLIVLLMGILVFITNGFEDHYSSELKELHKATTHTNPYRCMVENKFPCFIGNKNNIKAIIVGDSHADALTSSLASVFDLNHNGIIALTKAGCPFIINIKSLKTGDDCLNENKRRIVFLKNRYTNVPIFWVARTGAYLLGQTDPKKIRTINDTRPLIYFTKKYTSAEQSLFNEFKHNMEKTIREVSLSRSVYLVLPTPDMLKNIPNIMSKNLLVGMGNEDLSIDRKIYFKRNFKIRKMFFDLAMLNVNVKVLDPIPYLCNGKRCIAQYKNRSLYYDSDHMSEYGNKILTPMFKKVLD